MPTTTYSNNSGGLNITDSPLSIKDNQATGQSYNYDYVKTGAISKVLASQVINALADTQLKTLGLHIHHSVSTNVKTVIRAASTKIQTVDVTNGTFTNQSEDTTTPNSDFLNASSTQQVVSSQFNTLDGGTVAWMAGGGMNAIYGYTGTEVTKNGVPAPTTSSFTATPVVGGGTFAAGTYRWTLVYRKESTKSISNALVATEASATIAANGQATLAWTLSNNDTSKYDQILVYRSAISGVAGFTTGNLVAVLTSSATGYTDTGSSITVAIVVPREGSTTDNSELDYSQTYKYITAFKRRLVTCYNSTFRISELDKPESWPIENEFTIPSGGPITGIGIIGTNSEYTTGADEYLIFFKERELWVFTGSSMDDWELKFVDKTGAVNQATVVAFNGLVTWFSDNGIFGWDGKGRPKRLSKPIQALFEADGDLDRTKIQYAFGVYYEKSNQVIWRVSHRIKGEQALSIKLDTRLTAIAISQSIDSEEIDGVFVQDFDSSAYYAGVSYKPTVSEEILLIGDGSGFVYKAYSAASSAVSFTYETKPLDMGDNQKFKRFKRVIVWIERITNVDLLLYYWADYRNRPEYQSVVRASMAPNRGTQPALWDVALWDQAYWDDYTPDISPMIFNLHSEQNNTDGTSIKLRFDQTEALAPCRIHAFAIEWEEIGNSPIPILEAI